MTKPYFHIKKQKQINKKYLSFYSVKSFYLQNLLCTLVEFRGGKNNHYPIM